MYRKTLPGIPRAIFISDTKNIIILPLPYPCRSRRINPTNENSCPHNAYRSIQKRVVNWVREIIEDKYDSTFLTVVELIDYCRTCNLPLRGTIYVLSLRMMLHLESLSAMDENDGIVDAQYSIDFSFSFS